MKHSNRRKATKPALGPALTGAMILVATHPLHKSFAAWVKRRAAATESGDESLTSRKARKFLTAYPAYRTAAEAARSVEQAKAKSEAA